MFAYFVTDVLDEYQLVIATFNERDYDKLNTSSDVFNFLLEEVRNMRMLPLVSKSLQRKIYFHSKEKCLIIKKS